MASWQSFFTLLNVVIFVVMIRKSRSEAAAPKKGKKYRAQDRSAPGASNTAKKETKSPAVSTRKTNEVNLRNGKVLKKSSTQSANSSTNQPPRSLVFATS